MLLSMLKSPKGRLELFLWLVALHTLGVGIALVSMPPGWMGFFGFSEITEPFFKIQGGAFHFVVLFAYIAAARDLEKNLNMVVFSIFAKGIATVFLGAYFLLVDPILMVGMSWIVDMIMGIILYVLYRDYLKAAA